MSHLTPQKKFAPSAERNKAPIGAQLAKEMPTKARVLEIASGTGQHGAHFTALRPDIIWQYSDIDLDAHQSQRAYASENRAQLKPPLPIDVTQENWWDSVGNIDNIYCANMIHIAPWAAAVGLATGAGKILKSGDKFFLYGPFLKGQESAQSNLAFAQNLRLRNPAWGVRELNTVKALFAENDLRLTQQIDMPRDNTFLVFVKP